MKLYITGPVGSGKTTLSNRVSAVTGVPCTHLDDVVYISNRALGGWGNSKRPVSERDSLFQEALSKSSWVMEDAGRTLFVQAMQDADAIILLEPPTRVRLRRIVLRWLRQNLGLETSSYRPVPNVLRTMFRWTRAYDTGTDNLQERLLPFSSKLTVLHTSKETSAFLASLPRAEGPDFPESVTEN